MLNEMDPISPGFLFCIGFSFCSAWALAYSEIWDYNMSWEAFKYLSLGIIVLVISTIPIKVLFEGIGRDKIFNPTKHIYNDKVVLLYIIIQFITIVLIIRRIRILFPANTITDSISRYNVVTKFTDESVNLGNPGRLRNLSVYAGYVSSYLLCCAFKEKQHHSMRLLGVSYILSIISSLITGTRGTAVELMFVCLISFLLTNTSISRLKRAVSPKLIIVSMITMLALLLSFRYIAIGRETDIETGDYLAMYCGAQIPNFDSFLSTRGQQASSEWGYMTFINTINVFRIKKGLTKLVLDLPFLYRNGKNLGNVYTTFYAFYYDFGSMGIIILTAVIGIIGQLIYEIANRCIPDSGLLDVIPSLYGIVAFQLLISFFSNKCYEGFLSLAFFRHLPYLFIARLMFARLNRLFPDTTKQVSIVNTN